ncbi:hypothetical protein [Laribacter hongkongensis]|uniref:hypothetical protein n=1 Tax=Laribacter hongkongensis TaxID=168471 RepID=UPI001EFDE592|nr:hypothetical protein [Laribacter hongkongensis]
MRPPSWVRRFGWLFDFLCPKASQATRLTFSQQAGLAFLLAARNPHKPQPLPEPERNHQDQSRLRTFTPYQQKANKKTLP